MQPTGAIAPDPLLQRYLDFVRHEKRLAARSVTLYRENLTLLQALASESGVPLLQVQTAHVRRWVATLHARGRSARGLALVLSSWRGFYRWLVNSRQIAHNPVQDVHAPKAGRPLPKALPVDAAMQLADYQPPESGTAPPDWQQLRDALIVELLYGCGLRVAELVGLDVAAGPDARGWLDLQEGQAHVLGKGSKRRSVPLGRQAQLAAQAWLQQRAQLPAAQQEPALLIGRGGKRLSAASVWQRLRKRAQQAGLDTPVHPHMLRHSYASHLLQSSGDLRAVQELLGHANISTTQVYTRLDFQHLARIYDAAHPRAHKKQD
ncbi:tyrosine-type recombinase/integrase [Brachymonas sp. G13]|uniref:tyrosine-type recombinase/integrase n=1 Tax=Brachymonas TaxID=28219 RepID=UPI002E765561|nr:tyrosine-type recombinase/integrase [Brachymonas sp. J145]MEE1652553.1 tyrosine-type recombinase/integrase [Brachymonas sp. J145]